MKFSLALFTNVLLATAVVALPSGAERHAKRVAARAAARQSKPMVKSDRPAEIINATYVEYSGNWAGVALTTAPAGATYTAVAATFNVPTPTPTSSSSGSWAGAAWVGIDGYNTDSIWQSGIDFTVSRSGGKLSYEYDAWYEWYPADSYDFSGITISAGDKISVSIVTSSSTSGSVVLENLTTGVTVKKSVTSSSALSGENAEWIVEAFEENGEEVILPKFNEVTFTGAVAKDSAGASEGISSGTVIDMEVNNDVETNVAIVSSSELTVSYV